MLHPVLTHTHTPTTAAAAGGDDTTGAAFLSNPRFSLGDGNTSESSVPVVAASLLACVDAMVSRHASGADDAVAAVAAPAADGAKGKTPVKIGGRAAVREPEECCRYDKKSVVNGWGMGESTL
jgi:hypothetical protein